MNLPDPDFLKVIELNSGPDLAFLLILNEFFFFGLKHCVVDPDPELLPGSGIKVPDPSKSERAYK